jgi:hypothetical protein
VAGWRPTRRRGDRVDEQDGRTDDGASHLNISSTDPRGAAVEMERTLDRYLQRMQTDQR